MELHSDIVAMFRILILWWLWCFLPCLVLTTPQPFTMGSFEFSIVVNTFKLVSLLFIMLQWTNSRKSISSNLPQFLGKHVYSCFWVFCVPYCQGPKMANCCQVRAIRPWLLSRPFLKGAVLFSSAFLFPFWCVWYGVCSLLSLSDLLDKASLTDSTRVTSFDLRAGYMWCCKSPCCSL